MKRLVLATLGLVGVSSPTAAQEALPASIVREFETAWDTSRPRTLAALFTPDADFISPEGLVATGRPAIEAYYKAAFARGYARSEGRGTIFRVRTLSPDLALIDARFAIVGASRMNGAPRGPETGVMVAVLRREGSRWWIAALRENAGAEGFTAFP